MGYNMSVDVNIKISLSKEKELLKLFNKLDNGTKYRWVGTGFSKLSSVEDIFEEWRYSVKKTATHFIINEWTGEKSGSDELLWKELVPVVEPYSIIEFLGEDGAKWKYTFKNNIFKESYETASYEEDLKNESGPFSNKEFDTKNVDPYVLLGVNAKSTKAEIDSAYKKLAKKFHPDNFTVLDHDFEEMGKVKTQELNSARAYCLKNLK